MERRDPEGASRPRPAALEAVVVTVITCLAVIVSLAWCSANPPPEDVTHGRDVAAEPAPDRAAPAASEDYDPEKERRIHADIEAQIQAERVQKARDEAENLLSQMFRSAVSYYSLDLIPRGTGQTIPPQFPDTTPLTPAESCCHSPDRLCHPRPDAWDTPTWQALNFAIAYPHYLRYEFVSDSTSFSARAIGDLDCDGDFSTFYRTGKVINAAGDIQGDRYITVIQGDE